jgi:hypothetical protein
MKRRGINVLAPGTLIRWKNTPSRDYSYNELAIVIGNVPNGLKIKFAKVLMMLHEIHVEKYVRNGTLEILWEPSAI